MLTNFVRLRFLYAAGKPRAGSAGAVNGVHAQSAGADAADAPALQQQRPPADGERHHFPGQVPQRRAATARSPYRVPPGMSGKGATAGQGVRVQELPSASLLWAVLPKTHPSHREMARGAAEQGSGAWALAAVENSPYARPVWGASTTLPSDPFEPPHSPQRERFFRDPPPPPEPAQPPPAAHHAPAAYSLPACPPPPILPILPASAPTGANGRPRADRLALVDENSLEEEISESVLETSPSLASISTQTEVIASEISGTTVGRGGGHSRTPGKSGAAAAAGEGMMVTDANGRDCEALAPPQSPPLPAGEQRPPPPSPPHSPPIRLFGSSAAAAAAEYRHSSPTRAAGGTQGDASAAHPPDSQAEASGAAPTPRPRHTLRAPCGSQFLLSCPVLCAAPPHL